MMEFDADIFLPKSNEFLLFVDRETLFSLNQQQEQEQKGNKKAEIVFGDVPAEVSGIPVFRVGGEEVVFLAHILNRGLFVCVRLCVFFFLSVEYLVLYCQCRSSRHFGMFRDKKFSEFRRMVDTSEWRVALHHEESYEGFREGYSLLRLRDSSVAITLEGLNKWCATSRCKKFREREAAKCKRDGCIKNRCTCPAN